LEELTRHMGRVWKIQGDKGPYRGLVEEESNYDEYTVTVARSTQFGASTYSASTNENGFEGKRKQNNFFSKV